MRINIRLPDRAKLAAYFKAKPNQIRTASRKTVRELVNMGHKELGGALPRSAGTSVVGYRRVRAKKRTPKGRQRSSTGEIWMGTNKIAAKFGGKLRNDRAAKGAYAGRNYFRNSFVATMKNGYTSIFQRIAGTNKIKERYIAIPKAHGTTQQTAERLRKKMPMLIRANILKELNKFKK